MRHLSAEIQVKTESEVSAPTNAACAIVHEFGRHVERFTSTFILAEDTYTVTSNYKEGGSKWN